MLDLRSAIIGALSVTVVLLAAMGVEARVKRRRE